MSKLNKGYYFDYASGTPVDQRVTMAMNPFWNQNYGNPSSLHLLGRAAKDVVDQKRAEIAEYFGAKASEIVFCSGGTESDNMALMGATMEWAFSKKKMGKIIVSAIDHKAILNTAKFLERMGWRVDYCPVDEAGLVREDVLAEMIDEETVLVSIIFANNEIGVIQDIAGISRMIKSKNPETLIHTDACQAVNYLDIDVNMLGVDLLTFNAGKIYGPKGIGGLYVREGVKLAPMIYGGSQENGLRPGTENVPGIVGMAEAMKIARQTTRASNQRLHFLREKLISGIKKDIPDVVLNGDPMKRLANNVNISFPGAEGESLVLYLDNEGIYCSTGSACTASDLEPSHVLLALGKSSEVAHSSLRFSMGRYSSEEGVEYLLKKLPPIVEKVRQLSAI